MTLSSTVYSQQEQSPEKRSAVLVAYFSATGTTTEAARKIARITGGELYAITPEKPYTSADLNWNDKRSRSSVEMNDPKSRPAIKGVKDNIADYKVVYIGYPIWWGGRTDDRQDLHRKPRPERQNRHSLCHIGRQRDSLQRNRSKENVSRTELEERPAAEPGGRQFHPGMGQRHGKINIPLQTPKAYNQRQGSNRQKHSAI